MPIICEAVIGAKEGHIDEKRQNLTLINNNFICYYF